jgi:hypothetical protein
MTQRSRPRGTRNQPHARAADRQSGQALLELALVVPILVILVMAIFQFAIVLQSQIGLTNALREAARRMAATEPITDPIWANEAAWVQSELCGDATPPCTSGLLEDNVQSFDGTKLWTDPPPVTFCSYTAAGVTNYRVQAEVKYKHPLFFGPLAFATDLVDGTTNGFWDLSASAEMRLENIDDSTGTFTDPGAC